MNTHFIKKLKQTNIDILTLKIKQTRNVTRWIFYKKRLKIPKG